MPENQFLITAADNTLREGLFSPEFQQLPLFIDHPEWLSDLYFDLNSMITGKLSTTELMESDIMTEQVTSQVNSLLEEVMRSSAAIDRYGTTDFASFSGNIKSRFCPRFPIC